MCACEDSTCVPVCWVEKRRAWQLTTSKRSIVTGLLTKESHLCGAKRNERNTYGQSLDVKSQIARENEHYTWQCTCEEELISRLELG